MPDQRLIKDKWVARKNIRIIEQKHKDQYAMIVQNYVTLLPKK